MEEDIKILEEFKTKGYSMLLMKYGDRNTANLKLERALENLIKGYRELEQENRIMKNRQCIGKITELTGENLDKVLSKWYVPKSKIREKIEELEEKMGNENNEKVLVQLHKQRKILQELLEEEV